jgi:hypothetical protein
MSLTNWQAILGIGVCFAFLGVASVLWSRKERKSYYNSMAAQRDVKEFISREPERPWLNAWRIGGEIFLIIGVMLIIAGGVLWLVVYR